MRYYVVIDAHEPDEGAYVIAEVVRDPGDDKELTLAATLAGARARVASRTELKRTIEGRRALDLWDRRDDSIFEAESRRLSGTSRASGTVLIRAVGAGERGRPPGRDRLPRDPIQREVVLRSIGLREITRALAQRTKARRLELEELAADEGKAVARHE
jgi:hypothetical protein